jgi:hypothetical protein
MSFSRRQVRALRKHLDPRHVRQRESKGRVLSYVESWHAISEANRIFGFDGWDRETIEVRNVLNRETRGNFLALYLGKVRVTVRTMGSAIVREGHGSGEGRGTSAGEAHDLAIKAAETDATKRALATFGEPFGLGLYLGSKDPQRLDSNRSSTIVPSASPANEPEEHSHRGEPSSPPQASEGLTAPVAGLESEALGIDKSVLTFGAAKRLRDKDHLRYVAAQPCLLCGRNPSDAHHLRFAQLQALGRKVSDEFTVPLCRTHHRQVHQSGNEANWWERHGIDALNIASALWENTRASRRNAHSDPTRISSDAARSDLAESHEKQN